MNAVLLIGKTMFYVSAGALFLMTLGLFYLLWDWIGLVIAIILSPASIVSPFIAFYLTGTNFGSCLMLVLWVTGWTGLIVATQFGGKL